MSDYKRIHSEVIELEQGNIEIVAYSDGHVRIWFGPVSIAMDADKVGDFRHALDMCYWAADASAAGVWDGKHE